MKPSTLLLFAGLGGLGYYLWRKQEQAGRQYVNSPTATTGWRDEDLPPALRALPPEERAAAGTAYFGHDPVSASVVAADLHQKGYHEAASALDMRAMLFAASSSATTADASTGEGRFPTSTRA